MKSSYGKETYAEEFEAHADFTGVLRPGTGYFFEFQSICEDADEEIAELRAQLAECQRERDDWKQRHISHMKTVLGKWKSLHGEIGCVESELQCANDMLEDSRECLDMDVVDAYLTALDDRQEAIKERDAALARADKAEKDLRYLLHAVAYVKSIPHTQPYSQEAWEDALQDMFTEAKLIDPDGSKASAALAQDQEA